MVEYKNGKRKSALFDKIESLCVGGKQRFTYSYFRQTYDLSKPIDGSKWVDEPSN